MRTPLLFSFFSLVATGALAQSHEATVLQGGVARWSGSNASECGIYGRRYAAIDAVCYYPIDMKTKPGAHEVALWTADGKQERGTLHVQARECVETEIELDRPQYVDVSESDRARAAKERGATMTAVKGEADVHPRFSLPLAAPAAGAGTQDRSDFCELRIYNGKIRSRHTGLDYPIGKGTALAAPADGKVVLAEDQFYSGNAVIVDHGAGLVTMMFHLDRIDVKAGDDVKRGDKLGAVGDTGRATGPHLHFGARWQNQRIDVAALLADPARLPDLGIHPPEAADVKEVKEDAARAAQETDEN